MKELLEPLQPIFDLIVRTIPAVVFGAILYILFYPFSKKDKP